MGFSLMSGLSSKLKDNRFFFLLQRKCDRLLLQYYHCCNTTCHPLWGGTNNISLCGRVFVLQGGGTGGRVRQKRLPMPSRLGLSTQMRPPIASVNCFQMSSPRPPPPVEPATPPFTPTNPPTT